MKLSDLCKKKNIDVNIFKPCGLFLTCSTTLHAKWVYDKIYSIPYPNQKPKEKVARIIHGIQHASRVALYIPIFANLYRRYGSFEALQLNLEDIKLLEIAALFHDSGREDEGEDKWDNESAILLYAYLTNVLGIDNTRAKIIAEAVANKDVAIATGHYKQLIVNDTDFSWKIAPFRTKYLSNKNIFQKLIHDADCLDIIRARPHFDANYLDFYQNIAKHNHRAFEEMAVIIREARSIIELQGDGYHRINHTQKKFFETNGYAAIVPFILQQPFLSYLCAHGELLSEALLNKPLLKEYKFNPHSALTNQNLEGALHSGVLLARGIASPSALRNKQKRIVESKEEKIEVPPETLIQIELRKMLRRPGIPTRTKKENRFTKDGNKNRSTSFLIPGATTFTSAGLIKLGFNLEDITRIDSIDVGSGNKKKITSGCAQQLSTEEKSNKLSNLWHKQKMGGDSIHFGSAISLHSEVEYHVRNIDLIYFTQDPCLYNYSNSYLNKDLSYYPSHPFSAILQAIYIQNEYYHLTGKWLPIVEYSGMHSFIENRLFTPQDIKKMWTTMCCEYLENQLKTNANNFIHFTELSAKDLKIIAMYGTNKTFYYEYYIAADDNYDEKSYGKDFQRNIDEDITTLTAKIIQQHLDSICKKLINNPQQILQEEYLFPLLRFPELCLRPPIKKIIRAELIRILTSQKLFSDDEYIEFSVHLDIEATRLLFNRDPKFITHYNGMRLICSQFSKSDVAKYYMLAKNSGEEDIINDLQILALENANRFLTDLFRDMAIRKSLPLFYKVQKLIHFISLFDLQEDMMPSINEAILFLLKGAFQFENNNTFSDWDGLYDLISGLNKLKILEPTIQYAIIKVVDLLGLHLKLGEHAPRTGLSLHTYLRLANFAEIPREAQKKVVLETFSNNREIIKEFGCNYSIKSFSTILGDFLNDKVIFMLVLKNFIVDSSFDDRIEALAEGLPQQSFADWQLRLIKQHKIQHEKTPISSLFYPARKLKVKLSPATIDNDRPSQNI